MKKITLILIIGLSLLTTTVLWLLGKSDLNLVLDSGWRSASQILALLGTVITAQTLILSAKISKLEDWLDGLDKQLHLHRWLGSMGFIFLLHHPILLVVESLPDLALTANYLFISEIFSYSLGVISLYLMIFGFMCMVFVKLPYQWWLRSHQFLGLSFLFGSLHALVIGSDLAANLPLRLWLWAWLALGIMAGSYSQVWLKIYGRKLKYQISKVEVLPDTLRVKLKPLARPLKFLPGQFVFAEFSLAGLAKESHPFSISSAPSDPEIELTIKRLGDYTNILPAAQVGDLVVLKGPFGRFGQLTGKTDLNQVWVAGGIGITPFMSMLRAEVYESSGRAIQLHYIFKDQEKAIFLPELQELAEKLPDVKIVLHETSTEGRFKLAKITNILDWGTVTSIYCGPEPMMQSLSQEALALKVKSDRIHFEQFSFV